MYILPLQAKREAERAGGAFSYGSAQPVSDRLDTAWLTSLPASVICTFTLLAGLIYRSARNNHNPSQGRIAALDGFTSPILTSFYQRTGRPSVLCAPLLIPVIPHLSQSINRNQINPRHQGSSVSQDTLPRIEFELGQARIASLRFTRFALPCFRPPT